jgi:hypothetical protein
MDVQDPDTFLQHQFGLAPQEFLHSLQFLATQRHPPMNSVEGILQTLKRVVPGFVAQATAVQEREMRCGGSVRNWPAAKHVLKDIVWYQFSRRQTCREMALRLKYWRPTASV